MDALHLYGEGLSEKEFQRACDLLSRIVEQPLVTTQDELMDTLRDARIIAGRFFERNGNPLAVAEGL
jgi:hypothetical protein